MSETKSVEQDTPVAPIPFPQLLRDTLTLLPVSVGERGRGQFLQYALPADLSERLRELAEALGELSAKDVDLLRERARRLDGLALPAPGKRDDLTALADKLARLVK